MIEILGDLLVKEKKKEEVRIRLDNDLRRVELLHLGRILFGKYHYEEISVDFIAKEAGISKGLMYHYFPTKRHFYIETIRAGANEILKIIEDWPEMAPLEQLDRGMNLYLQYLEENSQAFVSLMQSGLGVDPEVGSIVENVRHVMAQRIMRGLELKSVTPEQEIALRGWVGFSESSSVQWLKKKEISAKSLKKILINQLIYTVTSNDMITGVKRKALLAMQKVMG